MKHKFTTAQKRSGVKNPAFFALFLLIGFIVLAKILSFTNSLGQSLTPEMRGGKLSSWDGKSTINVIFAAVEESAEEVSVVSLDPEEKKINILHLSEQTYFNVPKGFGTWRLGSVYKLGQEEATPIGHELLKLSISKLLGLPIDGVVISKGKFEAEEVIDGWRGNIISRITVFNSVETDLSTLELADFIWQLSSVRKDKVVSLDLERSSITESKLLADQTRVLGVNTVALDIFIRKNMVDNKILDEGFSIAIFNATERSGLAQDATRFVTNLGGNVVVTANTDLKLKKSIIYIQKDSDTKLDETVTFGRLARFFAPHCIKKCDILDSKVTGSRAQINIVLGEDFFEKWYVR